MEEELSKKKVKAYYFEFLGDFREYLMEYVRESVSELSIAELSISTTPVKLFEGYPQGKAQIKNQGQIECYITTKAMGGYRLDAGEKIEFFVNSPVTVVTASGSTSIGFIKC